MRLAIVAGNSRSLAANRGHLIRTWVARGHEVVAFVPASDFDSAHVEDLGIDCRTYGMERHDIRLLPNLGSMLQLRRLLRAYGASLILFANLRTLLTGVFAVSGLRVPRLAGLVTGLGLGKERLVGNEIRATMYRNLVRHVFGRCSVLIFQNPDDLRFVESKHLVKPATRRTVVAGSGVDTRSISAVAVTETFTFLMLSRLLNSKGIAEFVEAARIVREHHPGARFVLAGRHEPGLSDAISPNLLRTLESGEPVEYLGFRRDVEELLRCSTALVLPTYYNEGLPRSILEAMAVGRAVVATDWPGCRDAVVHGETGLLVPPRDASALSGALLTILENPSFAQRMGAAGRHRAEQLFDVRIINRAMDEALGINGDHAS